MGTRKIEAMKMRIKGCSYNEINRSLGIPKSTLSGWFRDLVLSSHARQRLDGRLKIGSQVLVRRNKMQTHAALQRARKIQEDAASTVDTITEHEVRLLGAALYWAEGYKRPRMYNGKERTGHAISFVNADQDMVRLFLRFLVEVLGVAREKIKANLRLYDHMNEAEMLQHWSEAIGLPNVQFGKTTRLISIASQRKKPFNRLPHGTIQIGVYDTAKFHQLIGLIEGVKTKSKYVNISSSLG